MVNYEDNLTPLGRQLKAEREAMAAQANPALMGVPKAGTGTGGQIKFNRDALMAAYQKSQAGPDAGRWFRITGDDGQSYAVMPNGGEVAGYTGEGSNREYKYGGNTGFRVFSDPGDFGGGWLTDGPEAAKMNGRAYDALDASGNYAGSGKFSGWSDGGVPGAWGNLAVLAMPFIAAGLGIGAAAGAGAGAAGGGALGGMAGVAEAGFGAGMTGGAVAGGATGAAGAAATAAGAAGGLDLGGGIMMTADGAITGATPFATSALSNAGILESVGAGGLASGGAGGVLSKAALDGTNVFGANSVPGALDISALSAAAPGAASANALSDIVKNLGYTAPAASALGGPPGSPTAPGSTTPGAPGSSLIPGIPDSLLSSILGPAIGGALSANASKSAADAQLTAAREAAALQEPFRQGGLKGLNRLLDLYGLSGNTTAEGYGSAQKKFGLSDFQADPGYQFRQAEGEKGMQRAASASGTLGSGKFLKDAMRFNSGIASEEYGKAYDRYGTDIARQINPLQALAGQGQTAANTIGEYKTQEGNATAAGKVGTANAINGAIGQGWSMYQGSQMMDYLKQNPLRQFATA